MYKELTIIDIESYDTIRGNRCEQLLCIIVAVDSCADFVAKQVAYGDCNHISILCGFTVLLIRW